MILRVFFLVLLFTVSCSAEELPTPAIKQDATLYQHPWYGVTDPTENKAQVYGGYTGGCIDGAVALPEEGKGFKNVNLLTNRIFGHPKLVEIIEKMGQMADEKYKKKILVGDLGHARGGPASLETSAHRSHQTGLDVDIWFENILKNKNPKGAIFPTSVLNKKQDALSKTTWSSDKAELLKYAASFPEVERVLVNPYVKKALCEKYNNAKWLNKIRPWWGHHKHFHMRLACPKGNKYCIEQGAVPKDDGCGDELAWWFSKEAEERGKEKSEEKRVYPTMPAQCEKVYNWESMTASAE